MLACSHLCPFLLGHHTGVVGRYMSACTSHADKRTAVLCCERDDKVVESCSGVGGVL